MWLALFAALLLPWMLILCGKKKDKEKKPNSKEVTPTPKTVNSKDLTPTPTAKPENEPKGSKESGSKEVPSKETVEKAPKEEKKVEKKEKKKEETPAAPMPTGPVEEMPFNEQAAFLEGRQADIKSKNSQFGGKDSPFSLARRIYKSHECQNAEKNKDEAETCRICAAYIDYSAQTYLLYKKNEDKNDKKNDYPAEIMDIENDFYDYLGKLPDDLVANEDYQKSVEWRKEVFASENPRQN